MKIIGKNIDLVSVGIVDAEFIISLRTNTDLNEHLSFVENDVNKQKQWIKKMLSDNKQYYFIVKNKQNIPVGTIRIYDIKGKEFCWGSWIILPEHRKYASLESIFLLFKFAFLEMNFTETNFDVRKNNEKALNFYLRFEAKIIDNNDKDYFLNYKKEYFLNKYDYYQSIIGKTKY